MLNLLPKDSFGLGELGLPSDSLPDRRFVEHGEPPRLRRGGWLPHAGIRGLWEVPAAIGSGTRSSDRLCIRYADSPVWHRLDRYAEIPTPKENDLRINSANEIIIGFRSEADDALRLFEALKVHGDLLTDLFDRGGDDPRIVHTPIANWCPARRLFSELWQKFPEKQPPMALIIKVEERLREPLENLERQLRTQLRRNRLMVPVARAEQIDAGCLRWLAMQPGRSLAERAGPKQEVLAVVRESTVDTFENRILKECLRLCDRESRLYLHCHDRDFGTTPRLKLVRRFSRRARSMLELEPFEQIGLPSDDRKPNYVLQYHQDYSHVWWAYEQLKAHRKAETDLWRWRHRFWGEIVLFDLLWAVTRAENPLDVHSDREIGVLYDPQRGFWMHPQSRLPIFRVRRAETIYEIEFSVPMLGSEPPATESGRVSDIVLTVRSAEDPSKQFSVELLTLASFLPLVQCTEAFPTRLIIRPHRRTANEPTALDAFRKTRLNSSVLPWPVGPQSLECGSGLIDWLIERASNSGQGS